MGAALLATTLLRLPTWSWATALNPCKHRHWSWSATIACGFALMIWIATEVGMIGFDSWLQPFHFCIGLVFAITPLTPSMRRFLTVG